VIITPRAKASNAGNWHTAARWARFLRKRWPTTVAGQWDGQPADCLICLHARRSAESIQAFAAACPDKPLIVVLTGTDLYRDIRADRTAQQSLELATHLVVLNELGLRPLPARLRAKTTVILQSAPPLARVPPSSLRFTVAVVGHLRDEKDPQLVWNMLDHIGAEVPLRVVHAGAPYDEALGRKAASVGQNDPRYEWIGAQPRGRARQLMRRAHVLLHPSVMEGGAQVVIEAITSGTPVLASRIDGNVGLLGRDYAGLFATGDACAAARRVERAAREPAFLRTLARQCRLRASLFAPAREAAAITTLVDNALQQRPMKRRKSP